MDRDREIANRSKISADDAHDLKYWYGRMAGPKSHHTRLLSAVGFHQGNRRTGNKLGERFVLVRLKRSGRL